jgi:DNA-binding NarL/FixJ family response regulator
MIDRARALVVEDDPTWQALLQEILSDLGLQVDVVGMLSEALERIRAIPHRIAIVDLALGDGELDNREGLQVLASLREQDPGCASILLTGYATVEVAVQAMTEYEALTCLRKSAFDRETFHDWVQRALARAPRYEREGEAELAMDIAGAVQGADTVAQLPVCSVLVVEDDAGWRSILSELLGDLEMDVEVRLCNSYGEALGCLQRDAYALAIVDLALRGSVSRTDPETSALAGIELLGRLQTLNVPAIVVSGVVETETVASLYEQWSIFAYLEKQTFDRRAFLRTVGEAIDAASSDRVLDALTPREREVLTLLAQGMTNKGIAETLVISVNTVKRHLRSIYDKLDVHSRAAATAIAVGGGLPVDGFTPD